MRRAVGVLPEWQFQVSTLKYLVIRTWIPFKLQLCQNSVDFKM